jgi:hypothetical protein
MEGTMSNSSIMKVEGVLARFENTGELLAAAKKIREAGYREFDCHSPFPIHGMDAAMGLKRSPVGWIAGLGGFVGTSAGLALQWWTSSVAYPVVISGKPFFSYQAYLPVSFALGVLFAAISALAAMLALNRLPRLFHPVFYSDKFTRASDDGFFVSIESADPLFDVEQTKAFLKSIGGKDLEVLKQG